MMKAAVVTSFTEPLEIKQVPIPQLRPNDILVKTIACGVCHSDAHLTKGEWDLRPPLPRIVGHEAVGEVVQLGSSVDEHIHVKKGDLVGIPLLLKSCLHCEYCLTGRESFCGEPRYAGLTDDGAFAEYAVIDAHFAVKLPEGMDPFTSAPLFCAGLTVYKALKVSQARPGQWVSIIGIGGLGSLALGYGVAMGFRMLAVVAPNDQTAVKLAKEMGAEEVFDGPSDQHSEWVKTKTGSGVQAAIVTVPSIPAYEQAFKSVKRCGRVVAVGLPSGTMPVPILDCVLNGIELVGSVIGTRQDLKEALEFAKLHKITCKIQKRKLEEINQILDDIINYRISGRVVIDFTDK